MSSKTTRRSRRCRSSTLRCLKPRMDDLEPRTLLSTTPLVAHPTFVAVPLQSGGQPSAPYTPAQIQQAYGFNSIALNGSRRDDRHRRCLQRPEHPGRSEHIRLPSSGCPPRRSRGSTRPAGRVIRPAIRRAVGRSRSRSTWSGRTPWRPGRTSCWSRPAPLVLATCSPPSNYGGVPCECRVDELGRRRVLGRDGVRQLF